MSSVGALPLSSPCPGQDALRAFHEGRLAVSDLERVSEHLSVCGQCQSYVQVLESEQLEDPLVDKLKKCMQPMPLLEEPGYARLEQVARVLGGTTLDMGRGREQLQRPIPAWEFKEHKKVGAYVLLARIGQGGMGVVYKAMQHPVRREVALKMVLAGAHARRDTIVRFHREGQAIARLRHANVVQIYEFAEHEGLPYFSMELVDGGSLAAKLARGPLPIPEAAQLLRDLARAVAFAHQNHVIHRDLKPSNILLAADGTPKITDFGLAKLIDHDDVQTRSEALVGTPTYMSPEQAEGKTEAIGPAADIYALGVILYETLTGRPPFRGERKAQTLDLVRFAEPLPPRNIRREVPKDLEAICLKCLEKQPRQRYATCQDLADDLDRYLHGAPTVARPAGMIKRAWHFAWRHKVACLALLAVTAAAVAAYRLDPQRPLREIEAALDNKEVVHLIGHTGKPKWFRFIVGEEKTKVTQAADDVWSIHTMGLCLVELLPDPRHAAYRFSGEVRHDSSPRAIGEAGVFFMHQLLPGQGNKGAHLFQKTTYSEEIRQPNFPVAVPVPHFVMLQPRIYFPLREGFIVDANLSGKRRKFEFEPFGKRPFPWRKLEIVVSPEQVEAFWDGTPLPLQTARHYTEEMETELPHLQMKHPDIPFLEKLPTEFRTRGSLGLFVNSSSASFRAVAVQPL